MVTDLRRKFASDPRGNIAVAAALFMPIGLAMAGAGVDYAKYVKHYADIQAVADMAAIAGAREYMLVTDARSIPKAVALHVAQTTLTEKNDPEGSTIDVSSNDENSEVTVAIMRSYEPTLLVGMFKNPIELSVSATAKAISGTNVCVIALDDAVAGALSLRDDARLSGADCAAFSNSSSPRAIKSTGGARLETKLNCSAGGYEGGVQNYDPAPLTDCPPMEDPLYGRLPPEIGLCDFWDMEIEDDTVTTLTPGIYCGDLTIEDEAEVTFSAGIYTFFNAALAIEDDATVTGEEVGFYFAGYDATFKLLDRAAISFSAPIAGAMAGILFQQSPLSMGDTDFRIETSFANTMVGTIYLPNGELIIDTDAAVADASAYTAIIAERINLKSSANLVLNANYHTTNVPVPDGIAGAGGTVTLRE